MESLVWPLDIVAIDEVVEPGLLQQEVVRSRPRGLRLQGQVHTLVAAILLRVAGLDALDLDAEPLDRQPAWAEQGIGTGKGNAVIGANGTRQEPRRR